MTDMNDRPIRDDSVAAVPPPERPSMTPPPQYVPPEAPIGRAYRPVTVAGPAPLALRRDLVRWGPVVAGLVTGILDELWQIHVPGRVSSHLDFLADSLGIVIGQLVYALWARRPGR